MTRHEALGLICRKCQSVPKQAAADLFKLPKKAYFRSHLWILTLRNPIPLPALALRYAAPFPNLDKFETAHVSIIVGKSVFASGSLFFEAELS